MIGTTAGKYRIIDRIGRGSMGTVYRASDETLRRDVAIKVLNADLNDPAAGRRFRAEAIAIARLNHPGIGKIYDLFEHEGEWLMAMEFVSGETLESLVARVGPLPVERAADLASQALVALSHAHGMGVVHRDLKPANIMVADGRLKVMDFGIARVAGTEHLTSAGLLMGTPAYMAPEQVLGEEIDARADLFAIGCVLFFLATAKLPFKGETAMEMVQSRLHDAPTPVGMLRHDLPAWFDAVVNHALARDPAKRFQTAEAFRDAIARGLAGLPIKLDAPPPVPSSLLETMRAGSMSVSDTFKPGPAPKNPTTPAAIVATSASASDITPTIRGTADVAATQLKPRNSSRSGLWVGVAAVAVTGVAISAWFWLRPPATSTTTTSLAAGARSASATPASAAPGQSPPPAAPTPTAVPTTPTPGLTPTPAPTPGAPNVAAPGATSVPAPGRRGGADAPLSFDTVKLVAVAGPKGEVVDATLKLGGGTIVALPKRASDAPTVALAYKELLVATFVRRRDPKSSSAVAAPPPDLTLPTSVLDLGRRPVRNWLVLQGKSHYIMLALADADAERILKEVTDRSRIRIDRPDGK